MVVILAASTAFGFLLGLKIRFRWPEGQIVIEEKS